MAPARTETLGKLLVWVVEFGRLQKSLHIFAQNWYGKWLMGIEHNTNMITPNRNFNIPKIFRMDIFEKKI